MWQHASKIGYECLFYDNFKGTSDLASLLCYIMLQCYIRDKTNIGNINLKILKWNKVSGIGRQNGKNMAFPSQICFPAILVNVTAVP